MGVKKAKSKKTSKTSKVVSAGKKLLGLGGKGGGRRRKKSALYYIKETQRLKAKKKYERERMRL